MPMRQVALPHHNNRQKRLLTDVEGCVIHLDCALVSAKRTKYHGGYFQARKLGCSIPRWLTLLPFPHVNYADETVPRFRDDPAVLPKRFLR